MIVPAPTEYRRLAISLPHIEVLTSDEDQQDIFRLRRDAYVDAGFLPPSSPPAFWDRFDAEPTTLTLAARFNGARIGGLRCSISLPGDDATTLPCGTLRAVRRARSASAGTLVEFSRFTLAQSLPVFSHQHFGCACAVWPRNIQDAPGRAHFFGVTPEPCSFLPHQHGIPAYFIARALSGGAR